MVPAEREKGSKIDRERYTNTDTKTDWSFVFKVKNKKQIYDCKQ